MPDNTDHPQPSEDSGADNMPLPDLSQTLNAIRHQRAVIASKETRNLITAIELENFKGISEHIRLELKPITLLFGPNSAGKSTVLQALHFAREVLERHNLDPDVTIAGGKHIDLGGFLNIVHQHDPAREIKLAFDLDLREMKLPTYYNPRGLGKVVDFEELEFAQNIESARVSFTVAIHHSRKQATLLVTEYAVEINGLPLARIKGLGPRGGTFLTDVNYRHPLFANMHMMTYIAEKAENEGYEQNPEILFSEIAVEKTEDALPIWNRCLLLEAVNPEYLELAKNLPDGMIEFLEDFSPMMSQLIVGPGKILLNSLQNFRYLGPIRETPPRNYYPPKTPDPSRWASGLAAWDWLTTAPEKIVQEVSDWLSRADRLNTGYRLERRQIKRLDIRTPQLAAYMAGNAQDDVASLRNILNMIPTEQQLVVISEQSKLALFPHDIGIGISQLLPVVAASLGEEQRLVMIEQPELHVHPRLQAELGDMFIEATKDLHQKQFIIETHSEHLALRLQRRVREKKLTPEQITIVYVSDSTNGMRVQQLRLDEEGDFMDDFPGGFFPERLSELR